MNLDELNKSFQELIEEAIISKRKTKTNNKSTPLASTGYEPNSKESFWARAILAYKIGDSVFKQSNCILAIKAYLITLEFIERIEDKDKSILYIASNTYQKLVQAYFNYEQYDRALETVEGSKALDLFKFLVNQNVYPQDKISPQIFERLKRLL